MLEEVRIQKLVHGGQGIGEMPDGRKVFVWNALPNEKARLRVIKDKKDYCEAIVEEVIEPSPDRIEPKDDAYLSTSPWQIMTWASENKYKQEILAEALSREKIDVKKPLSFEYTDLNIGYRNKMEYSFWADESGLNLALFNRSSHNKRIVQGSSIANPRIDEVAINILKVLNDSKVRGSQLKTVVLRTNRSGDVVVALFVKDEEFPIIEGLNSICRGIEVCYSTPKSPASVITKSLYKYGDTSLVDSINGKDIHYNVHSFFQVNLDVFELAVNKMSQELGDSPKVDLYCGVGTIGLAVGGAKIYVDIDKANCMFAERNVGASGQVLQTSSEKALDHIYSYKDLIVDPPRAGLHKDLVDKILEKKPPKIAYLSCNPSTQARDLKLLSEKYSINEVVGYNFFPRTPHIESLAIIELKEV